MKERIVSLFDKSKLNVYCKVDDYIVDIVNEINSYDHIMTMHSCEGHYKNMYYNSETDKCEEGPEYFSTPYLSFRVDEIGWDLFWSKCAPDLATSEEDFGGMVRISINDYISEGVDYATISIYGSDDGEGKPYFWNKTRRIFNKYFGN